MKTHNKRIGFLSALIGILGLFQAEQGAAQVFTTLKSFVAGNDGAFPYGALVTSGTKLYGTTELAGGTAGNGNGTVFSTDLYGLNFTTPHFFSVTKPSSINYTNSDGANPQAGLLLSGNRLYGTAVSGGTNGLGTVFAVNIDGTGFTNLHNFNFGGSSSDGNSPYAKPCLVGSRLYGTANSGGISGLGTVFGLATNGTGFVTLHNFTSGHINSVGVYTNYDGAYPYGGLIASGNMLYGSASDEGFWGNGAVFAVNTNGTFFTNLHSFNASRTNSSGIYTNSEGIGPSGGLILLGDKLYGTTGGGGLFGNGTVFAMNTNGTGFMVLYTFSASRTNSSGVYTNMDGRYPNADLISSGSALYGTTVSGGKFGSGTIFAISTDGAGFTNLHSFAATSGTYQINSEGAYPHAGLLLLGNKLYGTAAYGGSSGAGTMFSLSLRPPDLTIIETNSNVVVAWPTYAPNIVLQFTTNLIPPAVWSTNLPSPSLVDGLYSVTNTSSDAQRFFRLSQ
jgi:uncharacterized repeat protein (TIGR03803 family)